VLWNACWSLTPPHDGQTPGRIITAATKWRSTSSKAGALTTEAFLAFYRMTQRASWEALRRVADS
jgi:hypothetical protein